MRRLLPISLKMRQPSSCHHTGPSAGPRSPPKPRANSSISWFKSTRRVSPGACCSIGIRPPSSGAAHGYCVGLISRAQHPGAALALCLDDLEMHALRTLEEADASAIARDHLLQDFRPIRLELRQSAVHVVGIQSEVLHTVDLLAFLVFGKVGHI